MDHGPDVLPCQGGVVFENFLEIAPALKIVQNDVQRDSRPFDARSPQDPSGIRIGTAAETTRGKKEEDMVALAQRIAHILS